MSTWVIYLLFGLVALSNGLPAKDRAYDESRVFTIDYGNDTFLMDGQPFRYVAGSFHYFRALPEKWLPIMKAMRAGGLNAVDIYVYWGLHNPQPDVYNWEGIANLEAVIEAAIEADLYVILRPGPYICAEIDNGGHPYWLYTRYPNIKVRTKDITYLNEVQRWYRAMMSKMEKYMYGNGGPIIMVQVENEYGAFKKCDSIYKQWLAHETRKYTQDKAVLFTVDRPFDGELECGLIPGVFATTDFGLQTDEEVDAYWAELRKVQPNGPLVNSEFYTGWLTHWQEENQRRPGYPLANTLIKMLYDGANVNFYMYFGGTNFGFDAGANDWGIGKYMADITSYDYDAPLDEAGNPTLKYETFKQVIQAFAREDIPETPDKKSAFRLQPISTHPKANLLDKEVQKWLSCHTDQYNDPPTFEAFNQNSGFILYETELPEFSRDPSQLVIHKVHDRAWVYIDSHYVGTLSRENAITSLPLNAGEGKKLSILVENQGRINFQVESDFKGLLSEVLLEVWEEPYYEPLHNWTVTGFPMDNYALLESVAFNPDLSVEVSERGLLRQGPVIFSAEFDSPFAQIPPTGHPDTYLDLESWGKGVVFFNGVNLGRYWPLVGPQKTTYIPGELFKVTNNRLILVEFQRFNTNGLQVEFSAEPRLDK
jgi:beta-galactosidase